jgi:hypothetical protein
MMLQEFPPTHATLDPATLAPLQQSAQDCGEMLGRQLFERTELAQQFAVLDAVLDDEGAKQRLRLRLCLGECRYRISRHGQPHCFDYAIDFQEHIARKVAFEGEWNPVFCRSQSLRNEIAAHSHHMSKA